MKDLFGRGWWLWPSIILGAYGWFFVIRGALNLGSRIVEAVQ